jgi:hypothetical protein
MSKVLLALFVCVFALNSFACGGKKDDEDEKFTAPASQAK